MGVPGSPIGFPRLAEAHGRITVGCPMMEDSRLWIGLHSNQ